MNRHSKSAGSADRHHQQHDAGRLQAGCRKALIGIQFLEIVLSESGFEEFFLCDALVLVILILFQSRFPGKLFVSAPLADTLSFSLRSALTVTTLGF